MRLIRDNGHTLFLRLVKQTRTPFFLTYILVEPSFDFICFFSIRKDTCVDDSHLQENTHFIHYEHIEWSTYVFGMLIIYSNEIHFSSLTSFY